MIDTKIEKFIDKHDKILCDMENELEQLEKNKNKYSEDLEELHDYLSDVLCMMSEIYQKIDY